MPIIQVSVVGDREIPHDAARRLADGAGRILQSGAAATWVTIELLPAAHYAENESTSWPQPVFLKVLLRHGMADVQPGQMESLAELAHAIFHVPAEHVHIIVEAPAAGRVFFGSKLVAN